MWFEKALFISVLLFPLMLQAQVSRDSVLELPEIEIKISPSDKPLFFSPSSVSMIDDKVIKTQPPYSLVSTLNTVPGVRMEERSPGSYRLSIRGSLVRSPFGIRNIKIYIDEFPLTDAGGNTYLNSLDPSSIYKMEIIKGPEGSIYGANTGGVVLVNPANQLNDSTKVTSGISAGSYGLLQQKVNWRQHLNNYTFDIFQGYQRSDGYRSNSAMSRYFLQTMQKIDYAKEKQLRMYAMYSDLHYETPGGLTLSQFNADPRMARPAGSLPGAEEQKAGVFNKDLFIGVVNDMKLTKRISHVISVFGNHTNFKNPFITNFEVRGENSLGTRTYLKWSSAEMSMLKWNWYVGLEWQKTFSSIENFGNNNGNRDTMQASDHLRANQHFFFTRYTIELTKKLLMEAAFSNNYYHYSYKNVFPLKNQDWSRRNFRPQYMPKLAFSYAIHYRLVARSSISRGFSPPTIAEVRPSDNLLHNNLQAETGWNYEIGFRMRTKSGRSWLDLVAFDYQLKNAIVRRTNANGAEFFVNSGRTNQKGIEAQFVVELLNQKKYRFLKSLELRRTFVIYHFLFKDYQVGNVNYSGNKLTGVPPLVYITSLMATFPRFWIFIQYNYTSKIPLNDGNTAYANRYNLIQAKINYSLSISKEYKIHLFVGGDNLLNEKYSLGNDLNAVGARYYNAAPARNYYGGLTFEL